MTDPTSIQVLPGGAFKGTLVVNLLGDEGGVVGFVVAVGFGFGKIMDGIRVMLDLQPSW